MKIIVFSFNVLWSFYRDKALFRMNYALNCIAKDYVEKSYKKFK
ncbi:hypothetical protein [Neoehrlichia mikurensis]|nr:hypothetical protein [Neoehrlichia mikurensis]